jgi:thimet oligopeptidase
VLLSDTRYAAHAGTNTELDFVEAPSQMLEDWVYDPRAMALVQEVCPACPAIPPERLAAAREARDFAKGLRLARQRLFAAYDLALHGARPREPMALWRDMEGSTPLGHVAGSQFPAGFGHIAGHYAGGYYSYLWSLVLAEDLRTAFAADRLSADTGRRYRETILAPGGQAAPDLLMQRFLGRPWSAEAFFNTLAPPRQTNPSTSTTLEKP